MNSHAVDRILTSAVHDDGPVTDVCDHRAHMMAAT
jgi:hypothetical protein